MPTKTTAAAANTSFAAYSRPRLVPCGCAYRGSPNVGAADSMRCPRLRYSKLRSLNLGFNRIRKIEGLAGLSDLRQVQLYNNDLESAEGLVRAGRCARSANCA
jgi:hypothetical protein